MTIDDIAKKAGVSTATVSRVLNNSHLVTPKTREKVQAVIKACGYVPNVLARGLSTQSTRSIAVLVADIENPFFSQALRGITQVADENNYNVLLLNTDEDFQREDRCLKAVAQQQQPEGIIITPVSYKNQQAGAILEEFEHCGVPVVLLDRLIEGFSFSSVLAENRQGAYEAVRELIRVGHTRIAIIKGSEEKSPVMERWLGYQCAMQEAGLPIRKEYVCSTDQKSHLAHVAANWLMRLDQPPTAIFTCNSSMTLGCLSSLTERGLHVPRDVSVIGFDEIDSLRQVGYPLSVVDRSAVEMGRLAMEMMLRRLGNMESEIETAIIPTKLILCGSEKLG